MSPPSTLGKNTSAVDVASIFITGRIPNFWRDQPRLWFDHFEATVASQKQGDDYKFGLVISKLCKDEIEQINDILRAPPETNKYKEFD